MIRTSLCATFIVVGAGCSGGAGHDESDGAPSASKVEFFTDITSEVGLGGVDLDRATPGDYFMPDSMAAGVGLFDADSDGDLDLYLVHGVWDPDAGAVDPGGRNLLFRQDADGRFVDVTEASGLGDRGYGMGVAMGDVDNDGDVDVYVTNYGSDVLYRNDGRGVFTDITESAGITNDVWSASAAFIDVDGDGFLDVYVTNYLDVDPARPGSDAAGRPEYAAPAMFSGLPDVLYKNNGDGTFADVTTAAGVGAPAKGLGVIVDDLDDDGDADLYVANDGEANFAWVNQGDGTFVDRAQPLGLAVNAYGRPEASMGIAQGDVDGDGQMDFVVTHLVQETNSVFRRLEPGVFSDATLASGLAGPTLDVTGFGAALLDVELDGDLDLVTVNGRVLRRRAHPDAQLSEHWNPYGEPNHLFLNRGDGRFDTADTEAGPLVRAIEVSRGLATGDLDRDGDLDLVVTNGNGTVRVYRNDAPRSGHWIALRVVDPVVNRLAVGAVVTVRAGDRTAVRPVGRSGSYLSSLDATTHFGLGAIDRVDGIDVRWPDGSVETFDGGAADVFRDIVKGTGRRGGGP